MKGTIKCSFIGFSRSSRSVFVERNYERMRVLRDKSISPCLSKSTSRLLIEKICLFVKSFRENLFFLRIYSFIKIKNIARIKISLYK